MGTNNLLLLGRRHAVSFFSFILIFFCFSFLFRENEVYDLGIHRGGDAGGHRVRGSCGTDDSEEDLDNALMDRAKREALLRQDSTGKDIMSFFVRLFGKKERKAKSEALLRQDSFFGDVWKGIKAAGSKVIAAAKDAVKKAVSGKNKAKLADTPADESSHLDRNRREISRGRSRCGIYDLCDD